MNSFDSKMTEHYLSHLDGNIQWLRFVAFRIESFLDANKDIFSSRSDKGAHTVVLNTIDYDRALEALLSDDCYIAIDTNPVMKLVNVERNLVEILKRNHKSKDLARDLYQPALNCSPGNFLGKIFNKMLNACFPQSGFHLKDSYVAKKQIDEIIVEDDEILVFFDETTLYNCTIISQSNWRLKLFFQNTRCSFSFLVWENLC